MKESIIIGIKKIREFPANYISSIIVVLASFLSSYFLMYLFTLNLINDFTRLEILFFLFMLNANGCIFWMFNKAPRGVFIDRMNGEFNQLLIRPVNTILFYTFKEIKSRWIINSILLTFIFSFLILINNLPFFKFLLVYATSFIFGYLYITIIYFWDALGFLNIKTLSHPIFFLNGKLASYPPTIYEKFEFKLIFLLFPLVLYGVSTLYYFDRLPLSYFLITLSIAFVLSLIFNLMTYYLWKYGLKRYEAYG